MPRKTSPQYRKLLAKEKGFDSYTAYQEYLAQQQGFASRTEYKKHLAKQKGLTLTAYHNNLAQERQQRPENQELSDLIKTRLEELEKDQVWLAKQLGVSKQTISQYTQGKNIPEPKSSRNSAPL